MSSLRLCLRQLAHSPVFSLAAILVVAIGVGLNTAVFSVIEATLLRPLPFPESDRLVRVAEGQDFQSGPENTYELPEATFQQWRDHATGVFAGLAASAPTAATLGAATGEPPQHLTAARVTANFFEVLGLAPALGRTFAAGEDRPGAADTVVLSHNLWQRQFGGRRDIVGESILLNGRPHTVVGVMPEHFRHPYSADVWLPLAMRFEPGTIRNRYLDGLARLRPGVTLASADAALRQICADVNGAAPDNYNAKRA